MDDEFLIDPEQLTAKPLVLKGRRTEILVVPPFFTAYAALCKYLVGPPATPSRACNRRYSAPLTVGFRHSLLAGCWLSGVGYQFFRRRADNR